MKLQPEETATATQNGGDEDLDADDMSMSSALPNNSDHKEAREVIAKQESRFVFVFRVLVMLVLVISAICVSLGVHSYATTQEVQAFETKFNSDATKILES